MSIVGFAAGQRLPHYHTPADTVATMNFDAARAGTEFARAGTVGTHPKFIQMLTELVSSAYAG